MMEGPSSAVGISRGTFGPAAGGPGVSSAGGRRANTNVWRNLLEFSKSMYTDPYRWSIVKGALFFSAGIFVAREFAQIDFDEVVMSPPQ